MSEYGTMLEMILTGGILSAAWELPLLCFWPDGCLGVRSPKYVAVVNNGSMYTGGHIVFGAAEHWSVQYMFLVY